MYKKILLLILMVLLVSSLVAADYRREVYDYQGSNRRLKVNYSLIDAGNFSGDRYCMRDGGCYNLSDMNDSIGGAASHALNGSDHIGNLSTNRVVKDTGTFSVGFLLDFILDLLNLSDDAINTTSNI